MNDELIEKVQRLPCWSGPVQVRTLSGGITNLNFRVTDGGRDYVVRMGGDIPDHLVLRSNEIAAARAAQAIGVSPTVRHAEPGVLVMDFIDGKVFEAKDVREPGNLERIVDLVKKFHREMPVRFQGFTVMFWVFQVLRHYRNVLEAKQSSYQDQLPELMSIAGQLEAAVGPVDITFGHNDLLPANFIDDGVQIWLIDFDYAGFNSPLFDLANLASNNELSFEQESAILASYFDANADDARWRSYSAMKCASLLRETMWSMVSEVTSSIDFDYAAYTRENMDRFERVFNTFKAEHP